ncbi:MAG: sodium:alanine symporter family protein [Angelakisella sp.]|nr:sodium:alanine symporter family protein [Angelakisella sp.]
MADLQHTLEIAQGVLWGPATIALLLGAGLWFSVGTGWMQLRRPGLVLRKTIGTLFKPKNKRDKNGVSPFQAMTAALGGTMGTGNIAGIATAIVAGGPGAVFWMWVSAFFGMMTKYAEVVLAVHFRERTPGGGWRGGPMTYIQKGLGASWLAVFFSVSCVIASLGTGSSTQVHSMATALKSRFGIPPLLCGIITGIVVGLVILGGIGRISSFTEKLIPFMSLLYLACGCYVLWCNRSAVPDAFFSIFRYALSPRAAVGGVGGYTVARAIRLGVARGIFTNEAGMGSAPIAHASSDTKSPVEQGMWGIFEVFADTIVVCTLTALVLLSSGDLWLSGLDGSELTAAAFEGAMGGFGSAMVAVSLVCFALAAIIAWAYYGQRAVEYLTGGSTAAVGFYRLAYVAATVWASTLDLHTVWGLADVLNGFMLLPNLLALLALGPTVLRLSREYLSSLNK